MMEFTDHDIYTANRAIDFTDLEQITYWYKRLISRLAFLKPLMRELLDKGISLKDVSKELNQEYMDLIDLKARIELKHEFLKKLTELK